MVYSSCVLIVVSLLLTSLLVQSLIEEEGNVLILNDDNFDEALSTYESLLIEFYAPWCGHCKSLAPEWTKAATTLSSLSAVTKLAKLDATDNTKAAQIHGIKGFPTIKYFRGGEYVIDYSAGRKESDIVEWALKKSAPVVTTISSLEDLKSLESKNKIFIIGLFSSLTSEKATLFLKHASQDDKNVYAYSDSLAIFERFGVSKDTVIVIKDFDTGRADLEIKDDFAAVSAFIVGETTPLIQEFSPEASKNIFASPITKHALFFTKKESPAHIKVMDIIKPIASLNRGRMLFVNIPSTEKKVCEFFGVPEEALPVLIIADMSGETIKKYYYTGDVYSSEGIIAHIDSYFNGELKPSLKSEDLDPSDVEGPVTIVKGFSFDELVVENTKHVFLEMYAPWCGHCKKLAPIWDELGQKYQDNPNVVIAKMDATSNEVDHPGLNVKGYPSIFFFKGSNKSNPVKYEGGRTLNDFIAYLDKNILPPSTIDVTDASDEL